MKCEKLFQCKSEFLTSNLKTICSILPKATWTIFDAAAIRTTIGSNSAPACPICITCRHGGAIHSVTFIAGIGQGHPITGHTNCPIGQIARGCANWVNIVRTSATYLNKMLSSYLPGLILSGMHFEVKKIHIQTKG